MPLMRVVMKMPHQQQLLPQQLRLSQFKNKLLPKVKVKVTLEEEVVREDGKTMELSTTEAVEEAEVIEVIEEEERTEAVEEVAEEEVATTQMLMMKVSRKSPILQTEAEATEEEAEVKEEPEAKEAEVAQEEEDQRLPQVKSSPTLVKKSALEVEDHRAQESLLLKKQRLSEDDLYCAPSSANDY